MEVCAGSRDGTTRGLGQRVEPACTPRPTSGYVRLVRGGGADVRRIRGGEWKRFLDLRLRALREDPEAFASTLEAELEEPPASWQRATEQGAAGDESIIAVAVDNDRFVGMAGGFRERPGDDPVLWGMWVDPGWRGRGLGRLLAGAVERWAEQAGARAVSLSVTETNLAAISLYRALGYAELGDRTSLRPGAALLKIQMRKQLRR
jgi:ribosomal protein S18 acetylase RimI-like enzyme